MLGKNLNRKNMKKNNILFLLCFSFLFACSDGNQKSKDGKMDQFIGDLMGKMTLEEKIGQLHLISGTDAISGEEITSNESSLMSQIRAGETGALINAKGLDKIYQLQKLAVEESRMKIPLLFGMDFLHGYETIFPIPLGMAASWDTTLIKNVYHIIAKEATADGLNWVYSPMIDISRDPRWGRVSESFGEDPFLGSAIATVQVKGLQGEPAYATNENLMACMKHFGLYGASEAGRDYSVVDMSRQRMMNDYMPPYHAAVEAGVGSVMSSFNEIDGIPATANKWLLTTVLRDQWGFDGFVVTDYASINDIQRFGVGNPYKAAIMSLNAGTDMDMESYAFKLNLKEALEKGQVSQSEIDMACRRVLEAKYKLGLFTDPYKYCGTNRKETSIYTKENRDLARKMATESFVLMKNEKNVLPLKKGGTIAIIGPHGDNRPNMLGSWGWPTDIHKAPTILEGMQEAVGNSAKIVYAMGCQPFEDMSHNDWLSLTKDFAKDSRSNDALIQEALRIARSADVIIATLGESAEMSGESSSRSNIGLPEPQLQLLKALVATGKPVVLTLFAGRPMTIPWEARNIDAILNVWFGGTETGYAIPDVLFGDVNPSGKLTSTWPQNVGQIPIYYNMKRVSKPMDNWFQKFRSGYLDVSNDPMFPFGYGLSYASFEYGDITLDKNSMTADGRITANIVVKNTGKVAGKETVQMYIQDVEASSSRPIKELKGFQKIELAAGESKTVSFKISVDLLKFYNYDLEYVYEPGDFIVMIGTNSSDVKQAPFTLN